MSITACNDCLLIFECGCGGDPSINHSCPHCRGPLSKSKWVDEEEGVFEFEDTPEVVQ